MTNCSPQVDAFNRSNLRGEWGQLENFVLKQGKREKLCVFAGPVLDDENDKIFRGKDDQGEIAIQIPSLFWKVVVARNGDRLETFGFLLEQDLSEADVEFNASAEWQGKMIAIGELEDLLSALVFSEAVRDADQADQSVGQDIRAWGALEWHSRLVTRNQPSSSGGRVMAEQQMTWSDDSSPKDLKNAFENKYHSTAGKLLDSLCDDLDNSGRLIYGKSAKDVLVLLRKYAWFGS